VIKDDRQGEQTGAATKALVNRVPSRAIRSTCGVSINFSP
jgi:hypothetical protein